ncbi:MAG: hypothetical protein IJF30_03070 [Clostridia bacterium]|nr:hypothetical protein [Clostridia bacterium]
MKKETIKNIILTLLIVNCIQLTGQIWLNEKLWPEGYDFFEFTAQFPFLDGIMSVFKKVNGEGEISDATLSPNKVVINGGGARIISYDGTDTFTSALNLVVPCIKKIAAGENVATDNITVSQWQSMLRAKSIYINLGFETDGKNVGDIFGEPLGDLNKISGADSIIIYPELMLNCTYVCFKSTDSDYGVRYTLRGHSEQLTEFIKQHTEGQKNDHSFAFELRLDKDSQQEDWGQRLVTFDSDVLLSMDNLAVSDIEVKNVFHDTETLSKRADEILGAFGYKPSQIRKTVSQDGVVTYVENSATVKVSPDGMVEYTAIATDKGIKVADTKAQPSQIVNEVLEMAKKVISAADLEDTIVLKLRSPLNDTPVFSYTANFTRYFNGLPVIYNKNGATENYTLTAQFENGYIKSFKMMLQTLSVAEGKTAPKPVLDTINSFCETYNSNDKITVENILKCYYVENEGTYKTKWCIMYNGTVAVPK